MLRNIIWDVDGTLFDTYPAMAKALRSRRSAVRCPRSRCERRRRSHHRSQVRPGHHRQRRLPRDAARCRSDAAGRAWPIDRWRRCHLGCLDRPPGARSCQLLGLCGPRGADEGPPGTAAHPVLAVHLAGVPLHRAVARERYGQRRAPESNRPHRSAHTAHPR